ncbi:MAG TPA: hypothetical protein PKI46_09720 [Bacteroidales bacterium]|nr:hypothetical protein [Bacteroidales bacterium]
MRPIVRYYYLRYKLHKIDEEGLDNLVTNNVISEEEKQQIINGE